MYSTWEHIIASTLTYVPFALLFLYAFRKNFRFNKAITISIIVCTIVIRLFPILWASKMSTPVIRLYNYFDIVFVFLFAVLIIKSRLGRMLFLALMLKNTADAVVIFAKFIEHLIWPDYAELAYHWTYSVTIFLCELVLLPPVFFFIKRYFTNEIRDTISRRWSILWVVPFFFYLTWIYMFYFSSEKSDLELACHPFSSIFLLCSIICQFIIYMCLATLVQSLQNEARLQSENHAIQLQNIQYEFIRAQIDADRRILHDMKHHFATISSLVENQKYDQLKEYVNSYINTAKWQLQINYCSNTVLNMMASYYANKCMTNDISCEILLDLPEELPLSDLEITIVFGNLLENAFDACSMVPDANNRQIFFRGNVINNRLLFSIENTYVQSIHRSILGVFHSSKHQGKGIGIASCEEIIESHDASMDIITDELFRVNIIFRLP